LVFAMITWIDRVRGKTTPTAPIPLKLKELLDIDKSFTQCAIKSLWVWCSESRGAKTIWNLGPDHICLHLWRSSSIDASISR
jgi:hypothetical protein